MDCVRTAVRLKAKSVTCAYRRSKAVMPSSKKELKNAKEEGVKFIYHASPKEIVLNKDRVKSIVLQGTLLKCRMEDWRL